MVSLFPRRHSQPWSLSIRLGCPRPLDYSTNREMGILFKLFAALTAVLHVTLLVHALDAMQCESDGPLPTAVIGALLTNREYIRSPSMLAALDINEGSSTTNSTIDQVWDLGPLMDPGGNLPQRQLMCYDPGYIPICPGPLPCCPPSNTVCCLAQGICCRTGYVCGPAGTRLCCQPGGPLCSNGCCHAGQSCCTEGSPHCCPAGSCCGVGCCYSGQKCCGGQNCCDSSATCCGRACCAAGTTCCEGTDCCASFEVCDTVRGRCYDPIASSLSASSASARSASLASVSAHRTFSTPVPTASPITGDDNELEITLEPSDPEIQYDPPDAWSSSGGSCTNGTRSTVQIGAKITVKFRGVEISVSFVPKQDNITVSAELNGAPLGDFNIPGQSQSQCQLQNSWTKALPSSPTDQQVTFIYRGFGSSSLTKRASAVLELGEIRYRTQKSSQSQNSQSLRPNAEFSLIATAGVIVTIIALLG